MKKLQLLTLLLGIGGAAAAATFSGTVKSVSACGPAAGQKVYIYDTTHTYSDSAVTNSAGQYSFTLPSSLANPTSLMYYTNACGAQYRYAHYYTGANAVNMDFTVCGNSKMLRGYVQNSGSNMMGPAVTYLIRKKYDPAIGAIRLTAIDSTVTPANTTVYYAFYSLCTPTDTMLIKTALKPAHSAYTSYLPTYYGGASNWTAAAAVPASSWATSASPYTNFNLIGGTNPGGPGFIGGSVLLGANKTTGVGDPLSGRIIIVTNAANQPMTFAYSDASGKFRLPTLPYGAYKISGDAWGKANPALSITLSASLPAVPNVVFQENDSRFWGQIGGVGVPELNALAGVRVFPNPAASFVNLSGLGTISGEKTAVLRNITGALISETHISGTDARISTEALPAGVYQLQLRTDAGNAVYQIMK